MKSMALCTVLLALTPVFLLSSCKSHGQAARDTLCDTLRSDYACTVTYKSVSGTGEISGEATLLHKDTQTTLEILSPEPLSGMVIEYDTVGAPSSVALHFAGIDASLPRDALSRINRIASLAADDFVYVLCGVGGDRICEYDADDGKSGYFVCMPYGDAEITVCFSQSGDMPYSLEYSSSDTRASVKFSEFTRIYET